ncbi:MAG: hypothetical protein GX654_00395 [Desulfatiglans sp.]|nr:hypothetical protein [Desulfatiglans sp.]
MFKKRSFWKVFKCIILVMIISCLSISMSAEEKKRKEPHNLKNSIELRVEHSWDMDSKILDIYARLVRYQTAEQDNYNNENNLNVREKDYLKVSITDMRYTTQNVYNEFIKKRHGKYLELDRIEKCVNNDDICSLMYQVQWSDSIDVKDSTFNKDFGKKAFYLEYFVKVQFDDEEISYKAFAVYPQYDLKALPIIIDPVIPQINILANDKLPPVSSPWYDYISGSHYWKMQKNIKERIIKNEPMVPNDAPIGHLPGDEVNESIELDREFYNSFRNK